jgi:hypothetical protein
MRLAALFKTAIIGLNNWRTKMPLISSMTPKALKANIKKEIEAGKPVKQAVAIGYSVQREAEKPKAKAKKK